MLEKILLGVGLLSNLATLAGIWIAYIAAPASVQPHIAKVLLISGAVVSIAIYLFIGGLLLRSRSPDVSSNKSSDGRDGKSESSHPNLDALARKHGIYIGSGGIAAEVIDDTLTVRLTIFTSTSIELRYIRASLFTGLAGLDIPLESAEPHRLLPWTEFEKIFKRTLTPEETGRVREWADTVAINGKAKFEDHIEKEFSIRSALFRRARPV